MKKIISFALSIILILITSACGMALEAETEGPPAATPEVRVIEAGSGIFSRESVPVPEGWRSASRLFPGRGRAYVSFLDMSAAGYGLFELDAASGELRELPIPIDGDVTEGCILSDGGVAFVCGSRLIREYAADGALRREIGLAELFENDPTAVQSLIPCEGGYLVAMINTLQFVDCEGRARVVADILADRTTLLESAGGGILACSDTPDGYVITEYPRDLSESRAYPQETAWDDAAPGLGTDELYVRSGTDILALDHRSGETRLVMDMAASGASGSIMYRLGDAVFAAVIFGELSLWRELPAGTELSVLRLASGGMSRELSELVSSFNSSNSGCVIEVEQYGAGELERLVSEMGSGRAPDLYDLSSLPKEQFARRGYLAELGAFTETLGLAEGVRRAITSPDGGVYEFVPCFELMYCVISEEYVPGGTWTPGDMLRLYEETGTPVFDANMSRDMFLEYYLAFNGGSYIDGQERFDSEQFARLLEYASALPEDFEPDMGVDYGRIYTGAQLGAVESGGEWFLDTLCMERALYPGGCVRLGFPSAEGGTVAINAGIRLGVSSLTGQREAAEAFLLYAMEHPASRCLPVTETELREGFENWLLVRNDPEKQKLILILPDGSVTEQRYDLPAEADVEAALTLINSASVVYDCDDALLDIVTDEAGAFFAGDKSVGDVCAIIQDRAEIYIAEQFG